MPSTAEFSNPYLSQGQRVLALIVLLAVTGPSGTLRQVSEKLLAAHAGNNKHWTQRRTVASLTKRLADCLGRSARRAPSWLEIEELLTAYHPPARRESLLALVAGAYAHAYGEDPPGYTGPILRPAWLTEPVVAADTIRRAIENITPVPAAACPVDGSVTVEDPESRQKEHELYKACLAIASRAVLALDRKGDKQEAELNELRDRLRDSEAARDVKRHATASPEETALWRLAEEGMAARHPDLSPEQVRNLVYEQLRQQATGTILA